MANYTATTRSNYFRVKNATAFEEWCSARDLNFWTKSDYGAEGTFYAMSADTGDCNGWPSCDEEGDEIDITTELTEHLDPRDVAILLECGAEKLRYVIGRAIAIHPDGRVITLALSDIYQQATEEFGSDLTVTEAQY